MIDLARTDQLLRKIEVIDFKYKKVNKDEEFNIFTVLRNIHDEVNLHSRYIFELLNPKGSHNSDNIFLEHFLSTVGINDFSIQRVKVLKEKDNIDILITNNSKQAIILENKIGAHDQHEQLYRYYSQLIDQGYEENNLKIVYLSIEGKEPTNHSLGNLNLHPRLKEFLINISYINEIDVWLSKCIKEAALNAPLRESILQYKKIINIMSGNSTSENEKHEIIELVSMDNNALSTFKLVQNWIHVQWHTEWDFWNELETIISKKYPILDIRKFSSDYLNGTIHKSRNRDPWYGLMFRIGKYEESNVCLMIEKGDVNLYYGILMEKNNLTLATSDFPALRDKVQQYCQWKFTPGWLGGNWSKINFYAFNNQETLDLVNPVKRNKIVEELWQEIQDFIKLIESKLE